MVVRLKCAAQAYLKVKSIIESAGFVPWSNLFHTLKKFRDTTWKMEPHPEYTVDA